ncbi:hypothetical protein AVEN_96211-1 [Araneus ventricosus]|uniref:Uncharacterized protein n=1 Tax=Araneus ventricosus TaxID=182803 RepID=A0A4Y2I326_ARAVE|nr:hypothetical protein AVEN_96211-1 [Araneus ventricosus]
MHFRPHLAASYLHQNFKSRANNTKHRDNATVPIYFLQTFVMCAIFLGHPVFPTRINKRTLLTTFSSFFIFLVISMLFFLKRFTDSMRPLYMPTVVKMVVYRKSPSTLELSET